MRVNEFVPEWPNLLWTGFYSGLEPIAPNVADACIYDVKETSDGVEIWVENEGKKFSARVYLSELGKRRLLAVLPKYKGSQLIQTGEAEC